MRISQFPLKKLIPLVMGVLFLVQIYQIVNYSVNIPFADEWELFKPDSFLLEPTLNNLFRQHNEHRLVLPKLIFMAYHKLFGFKIVTGLILNLICVLGCVFLFTRYSEMSKTPALGLVFVALLFSPLNFENLLWVFQIQWHLFLLFLILSCYFLSIERSTRSLSVLCSLLPFGLIYTLGSGLAAVAVIVVVLSAFFVSPTAKKAVSKHHLVFFTSGLLALGCFLLTFLKPAYHPPLVLPHTVEFWRHFSSLILLGSGERTPDLRWISFVPLVVHALFARKALKLWPSHSPADRFLFLFATSMVGILASISISRGGMGPDQAFSSRYFEFSSFYFVSAILLGLGFLTFQKKLITAVIFLALLNSTAKTYNFEFMYAPMFHAKMAGIECAKNNLIKNDRTTICPSIYTNSSVSDLIENAKNLLPKPSFLENFE